MAEASLPITRGEDPAVKMPASVTRNLAAIEALYKDGPPAATPPAIQPPPAAVEPPVAAETPPSPVAPIEPEPEPEPLESAPSPDQIQQDPWANRYNAMRGRLGAETKKFNNAIAEKDRQVLALQAQMSQLSDELVKQTQLVTEVIRRPAQAPPQPPKPLITNEDIERHGTDTVDFVKRAAREEFLPVVNELQTQNQTLQKELSRSKQATLNAELTAMIPDWRTVNKNPRWVQWLRQPNIYSGRTNKVMLDEATRSADAHRVAAFFNGFLSEEKATGHLPDPATAAPAPATPPRKAAVDLASLAAPGSGKPASGSDVYTPPSKPVYKTSDFETFRRDKARGRYTAAQALAIEADMHAATLDGRIVRNTR